MVDMANASGESLMLPVYSSGVGCYMTIAKLLRPGPGFISFFWNLRLDSRCDSLNRQ